MVLFYGSFLELKSSSHHSVKKKKKNDKTPAHSNFIFLCSTEKQSNFLCLEWQKGEKFWWTFLTFLFLATSLFECEFNQKDVVKKRDWSPVVLTTKIQYLLLHSTEETKLRRFWMKRVNGGIWWWSLQSSGLKLNSQRATVLHSLAPSGSNSQLLGSF